MVTAQLRPRRSSAHASQNKTGTEPARTGASSWIVTAQLRPRRSSVPLDVFSSTTWNTAPAECVFFRCSCTMISFCVSPLFQSRRPEVEWYALEENEVTGCVANCTYASPAHAM